MRSENQKNQNKTKSKSSIFFIIFSSIIVCLIAASCVIIYFSIKDLGLSSNPESVKNRDYLLAEEYFNKGYLEDSEKYFRKFLSSNPEKLQKITAYQKLFEISVISENNDNAMEYLKGWQSIDRKNPKIYINRLKIFLRAGKLAAAREEINAHHGTVKQFSEYREIVGIYFMKSGFFDKALKEFMNIPFNKREYSLHEKIIFCNFKTGNIAGAKKYIKKIEPKIASLDIRENTSRFTIIHAVACILNGEIDRAYDLLQAKIFIGKYKGLSLRLSAFCSILLDRTEELAVLLENNESEIQLDADFASVIGDYYIYKSDYANALYFYEKIIASRELTQSETMTLADIYYKTGSYEKSIGTIQKLYTVYNYRSPLMYKNLSMNYKDLSDDGNEYFYLKEGMNFYPEDTDFYVLIAKKFMDENDRHKALNVINEGLNVIRNKNLSFDKRLEILKITVLESGKTQSVENELLLLREKETNTPEYYFKLIERYLKDGKITDAKREIDTAALLPLTEVQKDNLDTYKLVYYSSSFNQAGYEEIKKTVLASKSDTYAKRINSCIIRIKDGEYDAALDILNTMNDDGIKNKPAVSDKLSYLKAVAYFFKKDYRSSYKQIRNIAASEEEMKKASYLRSLIDQYGE